MPPAFAAARGLAGADAGSNAAILAEEDGVSHGAASIRQQVQFSGSPHRIYEALLDEEQFDKIVIGWKDG